MQADYGLVGQKLAGLRGGKYLEFLRLSVGTLSRLKPRRARIGLYRAKQRAKGRQNGVFGRVRIVAVCALVGLSACVATRGGNAQPATQEKGLASAPSRGTYSRLVNHLSRHQGWRPYNHSHRAVAAFSRNNEQTVGRCSPRGGRGDRRLSCSLPEASVISFWFGLLVIGVR